MKLRKFEISKFIYHSEHCKVEPCEICDLLVTAYTKLLKKNRKTGV